jgi:GNAT superfamily N-acetyltransferase
MIQFVMNSFPDVPSLVQLYERAEVVRPVADTARISRCLMNSNLVISAWDGPTFIGLLRALTDTGYYCLIAELVVDKAYEGKGIRTKLIELVKHHCSEECTLIYSGADVSPVWKHLGFEYSERILHHPRFS